MPTIEKVYKNGYLEKCELKEDEYGFYLDLHFAGIDGKDKDLYIPKVRLGFNRNVAPVIIEEPIIYRNWSGDYDCKVELGPGHRYILGKADGKVVAKTGEIVPFSGKKYIETAVPEKDVYTFDEIAEAFDMISAVSLKELLSKATKSKEAKESIKTEKRKHCFTCKWYLQSQLNRRCPCFACSPSYSNWEEKD